MTMTPPNPDDSAPTYLVTDAELAKQLRCGVKTIRRLVTAGVLPPPIRLGRLRRWDPRVVLEAVRKQHAA
jgi:excisionase family DNA binding protein